MDPVKNFAKVTVSTGYSSTDTEIVLSSGHGGRLPDPAVSGAFNLTWWNFTDYNDAADDPEREIVRCTARTDDTLTVTRGQESISATVKNISGKTYKMALGDTKKRQDDIETEFAKEASKTQKGKVELATTAETRIGTDADRAVTPDGLHDMTSLLGAAWLLDEDDMASDSETKVASQQSIKKYADLGVVARGAKVKRATAQTIGTGSTTEIAFTSEDFDTDAFHDNSANNTKIIIPAGLDGKYIITAKAQFDDASVVGRRALIIRLNDSTLVQVEWRTNDEADNYMIATAIADLVATDYLELGVYQNSGGDLNIQTGANLAALRIGA